MAGRIQRVERKVLARPVGKQLDQVTPIDEVLHADGLDAGDTDAAQAGAQHRAELGHQQATGGTNLNDLVTLVELPFLDRLTRKQSRTWMQEWRTRSEGVSGRLCACR